jgi:hypothetical protein
MLNRDEVVDERLAQEAIETVLGQWNPMLSSLGIELTDSMSEAFLAATLVACKMAVLLNGFSPDEHCEQVNKRADTLAKKRLIRAGTFGALASDKLPQFRMSDGMPVWFASDDMEKWTSEGRGRSITMIAEAATFTMVNLAKLRERSSDQEACMAAQVLALVATVKMMLCGCQPHQATTVERLANRTMSELRASTAGVFGQA